MAYPKFSWEVRYEETKILNKEIDKLIQKYIAEEYRLLYEFILVENLAIDHIKLVEHKNLDFFSYKDILYKGKVVATLWSKFDNDLTKIIIRLDKVDGSGEKDKST